MKKIAVSLCFILLAYSSLFGQIERRDMAFIRVNGTYTSLNSSSKSAHYKNGTFGFSSDLGYKFFLVEKGGLYLECSGQFFYSNIPFNRFYIGASKNNASSIVYRSAKYRPYVEVLNDEANELGLGFSELLGYDFRLSNELSLEVFTGPVFRYVAHYGPSNDILKYELKSTNLRLRTGFGLNYKRFGFNLSFENDLLNRGEREKHDNYSVKYNYKTYTFSAGLVYRFPLLQSN